MEIFGFHHYPQQNFTTVHSCVPTTRINNTYNCPNGLKTNSKGK